MQWGLAITSRGSVLDSRGSLCKAKFLAMIIAKIRTPGRLLKKRLWYHFLASGGCFLASRGSLLDSRGSLGKAKILAMIIAKIRSPEKLSKNSSVTTSCAPEAHFGEEKMCRCDLQISGCPCRSSGFPCVRSLREPKFFAMIIAMIQGPRELRETRL